MKKTVFLALIACGFVASFFVGNSMSQEPLPAPIFVQYDDPFEASFFLKDGKLFSQDGTLVITKDGKATELQKLQSQLLELTQRRIKAMKEEELKAEIARLQKQLQEQIAEEKFQQAQSLLREIVKDFPESQAAKRAGAMLKVPMDGAGPGEDTFRLRPDSPVRRDF